jgi:hypothetical protein
VLDHLVDASNPLMTCLLLSLLLTGIGFLVRFSSR